MEKTFAEIKLAQTGNIDELRRWLNHTFFNESSQVILVERRDEALLMEYLSHYAFGEKAQVRLVELGLYNVLLQQIERGNLCVSAQKKLVQCVQNEKERL